MASYIKASLERSYAESFLLELERNENQYFFFVARSTPWAVESSPPTYTDTVASENEVMNNMIGYKKITPENVYFAIPKYSWASGTTYEQYDDTTDLFDDDDPAQFYVVTDENKIYKCLGNSGGVPSIEKPTQVLPVSFALSDGYVWRYIASVRESDLPFQLSDYFPIDYAYYADDTETQNQYNAQIGAVPGSIDRVVLSGTGASGVSAGVYDKSIFGLSAIRLAGFEQVSSTVKRVTVTDAGSRTTIGANPAQYVGYVLKISGSNVNSSEVNNYGVITNGVISGNSVVFTVENDAIDFKFTPPPVGNAQTFVLAEVLPHVKVIGDGSGGFVLPVMTASKTIGSVLVGNGGRNYSKASAEVVTAKTATTVHPAVRLVLSPKEGHGSNILKELSIKDVLIVVPISDADAEKIRGGGSYRQFGIIKNPTLTGTQSQIAGTENTYYRDITLVSDSQYFASDFVAPSSNAYLLLLGDESYSASKIVSSSAIVGVDGQRIILKTLNSSGKYITRLDRKNNYNIDFTASGGLSTPFNVGELVTQQIPSGTPFGDGLVYGYDIVTTGKVLRSSLTDCAIEITNGGNFIVSASNYLTSESGRTAAIGAVSPDYGEFVRIASIDGENGTFVNRNTLSRLYKVDSVGQAYYDSDGVPSYRGLHMLEISTSVSGSTGALDLTSSPLSQTSFSSGDTVVQGSTAAASNYGAGVVYEWDFVNPSYGRLYLTGVTGKFLGVDTDGLTGTTLGAYIVASYHQPEINRNSGEILYIDNVRPITRISGQKEEFRLRLGF
jgi:hypothetical protein